MFKFTIKNTLSAILIFIPVILLGIVFQKYAVNIPHWDDFAIRNTLAKMLETDVLSEKFKLLFSQHNEHRILLTRITAWFTYFLFGTLNLKVLMLGGILSLLGILVLFYDLSKKYNQSIQSFIPVVLILLNFSLYENIFWGMASIQNFGVIFITILVFYLLTFSVENKHKKYFQWSILMCFIGVFTSSNGIIIPIVGALVLLIQQRKKHLFVWIIASIIILISFFYGFEKSPDNVLKTDLTNFKLLGKGLFVTLGSSIDASFFSKNIQLDLSMAVGLFFILFMILFAYQVVFKKYDLNIRNNDLFLLACLAFVGITSVGIVVARSSYGIETLATSKYKIYSTITLIIFYLVAINNIGEKIKSKFIQVAIFGAIVFNFYSFIANYSSIKYLYQERLTDQFKQQYSDKSYPKAGIMRILQEPTKAFYDKLIDNLGVEKDSSNRIKYTIEEKNNAFELVIPQNGLPIDLSKPESGFYVIIKSKERIYIYPSYLKAFGKKAYLEQTFLLNNQLKIDNFTAVIEKSYIESGKYHIGLIKSEKGLNSIYWTNQNIAIQSINKVRPKQNW
ncbi:MULTISPECIES: hypothetical protein [Emticicia]|uniref:hypothetical protein n=1 Tax=Emticicia TaxID=312278 RepID=UPI0007D8BB22|nr:MULTISPECIES: hypothetical protein [Emticicia]